MSTLREQILFTVSLRVGQGEKGLVKPQKVTVQEIIADIGAILNKINLVLNDHEQRLQLIEEIDLKIELELLGRKIAAISDPQKKTEALQVFKNLCDTLGIKDLESTDS
jgi:RNase P/RNase MRP subunit p30